jgi:signal transduction histidine kinase/CheY-like chemotaxis protein
MPTPRKSLTVTSLMFTIVVCLLFSCIVVLISYWPKHAALTKQLETAAASLDSIHPINQQIGKIVLDFQEADNNFRDFAVTHDTGTYNLYQNSFRLLLQELDAMDNFFDNDTLLAKLKNNVKHKDAIAKLLSSLHAQMDTLLYAKHEGVEEAKLALVPYDIDNVLNTVDIDTLQSGKGVRKKLFGRLIDAIKNRQQQQMETIILKMKVNKKHYYGNYLDQLANLGNSVNAYYKRAFNKLQQQQQKIKQKERQLVMANRELVRHAQQLLQYYQQIGLDANKQIRQQTLANTALAGPALRKMIRVLIILLLAVIILLGIYSFLFTSQYKVLIKQKNKSDEQAKIKDHMLATMSHELRTPTNAIIGFTGLLKQEPIPTDAAKMVDAIRFSSQSLLNIITSSLDYLKSEKGSFNIVTVPFKPYEEINNICQILQVLAKEKLIGFTVYNHLPDDIVLLGDVNKLYQLTYNIVGNAIKFTQQGGVNIQVYLEPGNQKKHRLKLQISDSGLGIPASDTQKIFQPYYQTIQGKQQIGTGLGLAICKELIELQGGNIQVTSTLGKGSTFTFWIEYEPASNHFTDTLDAEISSNDVTHKGKIVMVVDDDLFQVIWISKALQALDIQVYSFNNAAKAMEQISSINPDLVLTDIQMPNMDGFTFVSAIKQKQGTQLPVVACTGQDIDSREFNEQGFDAVLFKPFTNEQLKSMLALINIKMPKLK